MRTMRCVQIGADNASAKVINLGPCWGFRVLPTRSPLVAVAGVRVAQAGYPLLVTPLGPRGEELGTFEVFDSSFCRMPCMVTGLKISRFPAYVIDTTDRHFVDVQYVTDADGWIEPDEGPAVTREVAISATGAAAGTVLIHTFNPGWATKLDVTFQNANAANLVTVDLYNIDPDGVAVLYAGGVNVGAGGGPNLLVCYGVPSTGFATVNGLNAPLAFKAILNPTPMDAGKSMRTIVTWAR